MTETARLLSEVGAVEAVNQLDSNSGVPPGPQINIHQPGCFVWLFVLTLSSG